MKELNLGKTSLVISIIVLILALITVAASGWTTDLMISRDDDFENQSALWLILGFVFDIFLAGVITALLLTLPLTNLFGVALGIISLIEKREDSLWAWFGIVLNGLAYLFALVFHFFATMLGAIFVCPVDIIGAIILLPICIWVYRKRNKPIHVEIKSDEINNH
jgi:TRAP-type mannitol/chloroaromatic compound transport system permease large subunit